MSADIGYERTAEDSWTARAMGLFQKGNLQVQAFSTGGVISAQVWGTCPRCDHNLNVQLTLTAPVVTFRGGWSNTGRKDAKIPSHIDVDCGCGLAHDGAPEQVKGCGVTFRLPTATPAR